MKTVSIALATILIPFALACDTEAQDAARSGDIDLQLAAQAVASAQEAGEPVRSVAQISDYAEEELLIADPTVREIQEGRIGAPRVSSSFAHVGDEVCPQQLAAELGQAPPPAAVDVHIDFEDSRLLDASLSGTCILFTEHLARFDLVLCGDYRSPEGTLEAPQGQAISELTAAPDTALGNCYWCESYSPCSWIGKDRKQIGNIVWTPNGNVCIGAGWNGCC